MAIQPQPCVRCGALIPVERLRIVPKTQVCVKCSEEIGGEYKLVIGREKISKQGSLKKNYGGVTVRRIRKPIPPKEERGVRSEE
jgi:hypothetical protein